MKPTQAQLDDLVKQSKESGLPMWLFDEGWVAPALRLTTDYYPDNVVAYTRLYRNGKCEVELVKSEQRIPENYHRNWN